MSLVTAKIGKAARLKPEIRLAQAVSQFKAILDDSQKATFEATTSNTLQNAPGPHDVMRFTTEYNQRVSILPGNRCYGPRLTNFLHGVQQFASLGDVVIGGSQNIIACGVWSVVRMSLLATINISSYLDRLSLLFMEVGRTAPRNQAMALLYRHSANLQASLFEYYIVVVHLCQHIMNFSRASLLRKMTTSLGDSDLKDYQAQLEQWSTQIKDELQLHSAISIEKEVHENSKNRRAFQRAANSSAYERQLAMYLRNLDRCSVYDFETTWKQLRKKGNTSLFLSVESYQEWKSSRASSTLIFIGRLGCGKSVMMANLVEDLTSYTRGALDVVAYFFCKHDILEGLKANTVIASLTRQLLRPWPSIPELQEVDTSSRNASDLLNLLWHWLPGQAKVYLVLDGLDQCPEDEQREISGWVQQLQTERRVLLCISSRDSPGSMFIPTLQSRILTKSIPIPENSTDINQFIDSELESCLQAGELNLGDPSLITEIRDALVQGSKGMFLWATLQIKSLCTMQSDKEIREALLHLPQDLSETYRRVLQHQRKQHQEAFLVKYQQRIFELISAAWRPLTIYETKEALSIVPGVINPDLSESLNNIHATLRCCGCLVTVDEDELTVRLVHPSVEQSLMAHYQGPAGSSFTAPKTHLTMAEHIVTYLSYPAFRGEVSSLRIPEMNVAVMPSRIATSTVTSRATRALALKLLKAGRHPHVDVSKTLAEALDSHRRSLQHHFHFSQYAKMYCTQHFARVFYPGPHIGMLLPELLKNDILSLPNGTVDFDPFSFMIEVDNTEMLKILYAKTYTDTLEYSSKLIAALRAAIEKDSRSTLRSIVETFEIGYDFEFIWGYHSSEFIWGSDTSMSNYLTPVESLLWHAARREKLNVLDLILTQSTKGSHDVFLYLLSSKKPEYIAKLVLQKGDVHCSDDVGEGSMLYLAVTAGYETIVEYLLLQRGRLVDSQQERDLMDHAVAMKNWKIVERLKRKGWRYRNFSASI